MAKTKAVQRVPSRADYVVLGNQISRAAHDLTTMQARIVYLAMAQVRPKDDELPVVEMNVGDMVQALGLHDSGRQYQEIRAGVKGAMGKILDLDTDEGWVMFPWFTRARFIKSRDCIQVKFAEELAPYILDLQQAFSILTIADLSRLQGRYALRIFEIVMSWRGQAGKAGNKPGHWFVDLDFDHLRTLFKIGETEYKLKADFRKRVIEVPVREINGADLGLRIDCDYEHFRRGRKLLGVRLLCQSIGRDDPLPVKPATKQEEDEEALIDAHPERFEALLKEVRAQPDLPAVPPFASIQMREIAQRGEAVKLLKEELAAKKGRKK